MEKSKKKVHWGILGTANIAKKVGRAIHRAKGTELTAIASRDEGRARDWAADHDVNRAYGSYDTLLDDAEIDAVYIPLPPSMHLEWTAKAAERGKHVLCEKPLAANAEEALAMAEVCKKNDVQLMDGVMWMHHERAEMMKKAVDDGALGELRRVTSAFSFNWGELPVDNIRMKRELAGGCLGDLGYYCVRAILWTFGDLPTSVYATARFLNDVEFNLSGVLWFRDKRMASFDSAFDTTSRQWFEVAGDAGSLVCDDFVVPKSEKKARFWIHGKGDEDGKREVKGCVQEVRMIDKFSRIVQTGQLEERWPRMAIETMQVYDALLKSAGEEKRVEMGGVGNEK